MTEETQKEQANSTLEPPHAGTVDLAESVEIARTGGVVKAKVHHFPALTGWELRRQYREYIESKDSTFRMQFTVLVLSHATIIAEDGAEISLHGAESVNAQLETWQNIEILFNAVLGYNGIKTDVVEVERRRWQVAGEDMASSFLAAVSSTIGPALSIAASKKN